MAEFTKLGKYEVRGELGRGAMGVVYEGFDPNIERVVALKTIRADQLVGENAREIVARFRREAQAAGRLSHPNIVSIYDFGEDAGVWYIVMESKVSGMGRARRSARGRSGRSVVQEAGGRSMGGGLFSGLRRFPER